MCDIVIIMREYFGDESSFTFYLDEKDSENIFDKVNSLKILLKQIDVFFFEIIRADKKLYENSKYVSMSFNLFWSILQYLLDSKAITLGSNLPKNDDFGELRSELEGTLKDYENKLFHCRSDIERKIISDTINGIKRQLSAMKIQDDDEHSVIKKEESRLKKLREIFEFYSKQQKNAKKDQTFEYYNKELASMSVGEWIKFCKDFQLYSKKHDQKVGILELTGLVLERDVQDGISRNLRHQL